MQPGKSAATMPQHCCKPTREIVKWGSGKNTSRRIERVCRLLTQQQRAVAVRSQRFTGLEQRMEAV